MSRIGKKPIDIPAGVTLSVANGTVTVEGAGGKKLQYQFRPEVTVAVQDNKVTVTRQDDERESRAYHGLTRALIQNMIVGVTQGYVKKLELHGVGYGADLRGKALEMRVGFANTISVAVPEGLEVSVAMENAQPPRTGQCQVVTVKGIDKQLVGQFAAQVRSVRKCEPYKGKGVQYAGEVIRRKAGKAQAK